MNDQLKALHSISRGGRMRWLKWTFVVLSVVLAAVGLYTGQPPYFMALVLTALIASSAHQTGPHIYAASEAIQSGSRVDGLVTIDIDRPLDTDRFYATVATEPGLEWRFEFIAVGWSPVPGRFPATFYILQNVAWPALIEVQDQYIHPRYTPQKVQR
jgi:hypothetical protein